MIGFGIAKPQANGKTTSNDVFGGLLISLMSNLITSGVFVPANKMNQEQPAASAVPEYSGMSDRKQAYAGGSATAKANTGNADGTMLTGSLGVNPEDLLLSKKSLLGA
jgi:hypothetical protein